MDNDVKYKVLSVNISIGDHAEEPPQATALAGALWRFITFVFY